MNASASGLFVGVVNHERFTPRRHQLRYRMFQTLLDLDEIPALASGRRWFSHNRFNLFSFHDRDHGDGQSAPLRSYVERVLAAGGVTQNGGQVLLLCMPRIFGHVFNPLSIYFCHDADGAISAMIYEVNNTFGQRHSYLIPAAPDRSGGDIIQSCDKALYVSPFMDMAMTYDFRVTPPGDRIATTIHGRGVDGELIIAASFSGARRALSDRNLLATLIHYPLLTLKVVAAIHWEAVKLALKGLRLRPRPPAPSQPISVAAPPRPAELHKTIKQSA